MLNTWKKLLPEGHNAAALLMSLVALVIFLINLYLAVRDPEVLLRAPNKVRLMQATADNEAELYIQPSFVNTGKGGRGDVIESIRLLVSHLPDGERQEGQSIWFGAESYGKWDFSKEEYDKEW